MKNPYKRKKKESTPVPRPSPGAWSRKPRVKKPEK
jgi:hypothetical protein